MMTRTLIAVPCMDMVHTDFLESMVNLQRIEGLSFTTARSTLIAPARNMIAASAIREGFDRVMWFDSDMKFAPDTLKRLSAHMDNGLHYVSGLYFSRRPPVIPIVYNELWWSNKDGVCEHGAKNFFDYPETLTECAASGFGCVMTSVDLLRRVGEKFGSPFAPLQGMGEDLSFCFRVIQLGEKMYFDPSIKCGHVGIQVFDETLYQGEPHE